jgi:hypothetical protein
MTTQIKRRRGTTTEHSTFTGAEGELTIDTTKDTVVVHDGSTAGGHPLAKESSITGKVDTSGDTMTGDLSFGDNDKAIFGAGSDLEIYHDGSASYVSDVGTGDLNVKGANVQIRASNNDTMAFFAENGEAKLFYDGSTKLATTSTGVDVTGTITSDGLTVNSNGEILVDNPTQAFLKLDRGDAASHYALTRYYTGGTEDWRTGTYNDATSNYNIGTSTNKYVSITTGGDISFYEDTGTTPKFFWDASAESLGIGTSSPDKDLTVSGEVKITGSLPRLFFDNTSDGIGEVEAIGLTATDLRFGYAQDNIVFRSNSSERMRIDSSGNVGIGTTSPDSTLHVLSTALPQLKIDYNGTYYSTISNNGTLNVVDPGTDNKWVFLRNGTEQMRIDSSGNVGIGTSSPAQKLHVNGGQYTGLRLETTNALGASYIDFGDNSDADVGGIVYWHTDNSMRLVTNAAEAMRIDSSGNLLVGTSNQNWQTEEGMRYFTGDSLVVTRSSATPFSVNRLTDDGDLAVFRKDGTTVGSIGSIGGDIFVGTGDTTLRFYDAGNAITPRGTNGAGNNGVIDLGGSSERFKNLYLSGGVYLGGTGSANKLDDYESGTFTPVLEGDSTAGDFTYTHRAGWYTKVGNLVTAHINLAAYVTSGGTAPVGSLLVTGMPFTANDESVGSFQCNDMANSYQTNVAQYTAIIQGSNSHVHYRGTKNDGSAHATMQAQSMSYLRSTISYTTSS